MKLAIGVCWVILVFYMFVVLYFQEKGRDCVPLVVYYSICLSPLFAFFLLGLITQVVYNNENATDDSRPTKRQDPTDRSGDGGAGA